MSPPFYFFFFPLCQRFCCWSLNTTNNASNGGFSPGVHLFPFRTESLSPGAPMVLPSPVGESVAANFINRTLLTPLYQRVGRVLLFVLLLLSAATQCLKRFFQTKIQRCLCMKGLLASLALAYPDNLTIKALTCKVRNVMPA